jgi:probable non-F420 flavinoid oxidoreductase
MRSVAMMVRVGYHASHEQVPPGQLRDAVVAAEAAGFQAAMCSDHFAPWGKRQGQSGHAWTWLGAAMQASGFSMGVVTAPGQRYHPAVTAQAIATLGEMFPGRFWAALGSGEALNEHITGERWPPKPVRVARLSECVEVMRALLRGEEVTHQGLIHVHRAKLWTLPATLPPLLGAAVTEASARRVGAWADGMITVNQPEPVLRRVIDAFKEGGGDGKPVHVQVHLAWADDEATATAIAHEQWATNVFGGQLAWELEQPEQFDEAARHVRPDDLGQSVMISADPGRHAAQLDRIAQLGVDTLFLHHVGTEQRRFIEVFGERVVPEVAR